MFVVYWMCRCALTTLQIYNKRYPLVKSFG